MNNNYNQIPNNQVNNQNNAVYTGSNIQNQAQVTSMPVTNNVVDNNTPPKKKGHGCILFLLLIIVLLAGGCYFLYYNFQNYIQQLRFNCTPVSSYDEDKELDINSTLVQSLYNKVSTNIKEDYAQPNFDDTMRLYLAYRQVLDKDKYESNCNMFDNSKMEPYICEDSNTFTPKAFKSSTLILEYKKLFGEESNVNLNDIKLTYTCIGGYQYIEGRDEYVQGLCTEQSAITFKVDKKLVKAITNGNTIILTEEVKYHSSEKMDLPDYLKSGNYIYTFRLDVNYNYVLVSKLYDSKY